MEMIEKVERLREKANVSYEEAKAALEQTGGDLLDAIVLLERQGKVKEPAHSTFSTEYEEQKEYIKVRDKVEEQENSAPSMGRTIGRAFRGLIRFIKQTTFIVTKGEDVVFTMPTLVVRLLGAKDEEEAEKANSILNKAGDFAQDVKSEFTKNESGSEES